MRIKIFSLLVVVVAALVTPNRTIAQETQPKSDPEVTKNAEPSSSDLIEHRGEYYTWEEFSDQFPREAAWRFEKPTAKDTPFYVVPLNEKGALDYRRGLPHRHGMMHKMGVQETLATKHPELLPILESMLDEDIYEARDAALLPHRDGKEYVSPRFWHMRQNGFEETDEGTLVTVFAHAGSSEDHDYNDGSVKEIWLFTPESKTLKSRFLMYAYGQLQMPGIRSYPSKEIGIESIESEEGSQEIKRVGVHK